MTDEEKLRMLLENNCIVGNADIVCWIVRKECLRLREHVRSLEQVLRVHHYISQYASQRSFGMDVLASSSIDNAANLIEAIRKDA